MGDKGAREALMMVTSWEVPEQTVDRGWRGRASPCPFQAGYPGVSLGIGSRRSALKT